MARISGKLTAKALGWDRNAIGTAVKKVPMDGGRVLIGRIVGIVAGLHQTVNDDTGEVQTGLKGSFRGISSLTETIDGKEVVITCTAGRCYLPGGLQEMIEAGYQTAAAEDAKATVNFALDLYAIPSTNKAGYSYDGNTLIDAAASDPLDMLLASASGVEALPQPEPQAALTAPEPAADPAPEPAPEPAPAKGSTKAK